MDDAISPAGDAGPRRTPTAAEARALGHPTRLRIVFACRDRALTTSQLAAHLDTTPGTVHYHLRALVDQGFLQRESPRRGARGAHEQPYRATGKSWQIAGDAAGSGALRRAGVDELLAAPDDDVLSLTRLGVTLPTADLDELLLRLHDLVEQLARRGRDEPPATDAESVTLFLAVTRAPRGEEGGVDRAPTSEGAEEPGLP